MSKILLESAINAAVHQAVVRPDVPATVGAVGPIVDAVMKEAAPIVENATNAEPWYRSRVTWGVIITGAATLTKIIVPDLEVSAEDVNRIAEAAATVGQGAGLLLTLYGRWKAKRPIGR